MATDPGESPDDQEDEQEWRFSLSDLENGDGDGEGGNVAGALTPDGDIEPGDIDPENAVFVAAGMVLAVLVIMGFVLFL